MSELADTKLYRWHNASVVGLLAGREVEAGSCQTLPGNSICSAQAHFAESVVSCAEIVTIINNPSEHSARGYILL